MKKITKQNKIKDLLIQNISVKEISIQMKTNVSYVYKIKKYLNKEISI